MSRSPQSHKITASTTTKCCLLALFLVAPSAPVAAAPDAAPPTRTEVAPAPVAGQTGNQGSTSTSPSPLPVTNPAKLSILVRMVKVKAQLGEGESIKIDGLSFGSIGEKPQPPTLPSPATGSSTPATPAPAGAKTSVAPGRRPYILIYLRQNLQAHLYLAMNSVNMARVVSTPRIMLADGEPGVCSPYTAHITFPNVIGSFTSADFSFNKLQEVPTWYANLLARLTPEGGVSLKLTIHDPGLAPVPGQPVQSDPDADAIVVPTIELGNGESFMVAARDERSLIGLNNPNANSSGNSTLSPPQQPGNAMFLYFITVNRLTADQQIIPH